MFKHLQFNYKNDADNLEDTCINTAIDTISASAKGKRTLMPAAIFDAFKLLLSNKNETGRKSNKIKKFWKNSQEEVIKIRSLTKAFYLMT